MNPNRPDDGLRPEGALPATIAGDRPPATRLALPAAAATLSGRDLVHALERRWPVAILGGLVVGVAAALGTYLLVPPPRYSVKAMIQVASAPIRIIFQTSESVPDYRSYQKTQATLVKSRRVLTAALRQPEAGGLTSLPTGEDRVTWLDRELKVDFPGGGEIMTITMTGANPGDATTLVNATSEAYLKQIVEEERRDRVIRYNSLQNLFNKLQDELKEKRKTYRISVEDIGVTDKESVAARQQTATRNLGLLQVELGQIQAEIRQIQRRVKVAAARRGAANANANTTPPSHATQAEDAVRQDAGIAELQRTSSGLAAELTRLRQASRDGNDPSVARARERYEASQRNLKARAEQIRAAVVRDRGIEGRIQDESQQVELEQTLVILQEQEKLLAEQVATLGADLKSGNVKTLDMNWLDDEIALTTQAAKTVGTEVESLKVELSAQPRIRLIERAESPVMSDPMRRYKFSWVAGLGCFVLFAGSILLLEVQARRVGSPDEVPTHLGLRLIGSIPARPPARQLRKLDDGWQRVLIESVDAARTMILHASLRDPLKVIIVASAVNGEGKTTLACLLAASLQRAGRRTLLIDGDLRCPAIHRLMDITAETGLCEVLRGERDPHEVIIPAAGPGVDFLPAGRLDNDVLQGLADGRLARLIEELRDNYDQIIIDSAPALFVPDGLIMAQHADAAILAVLRGVSRVPTLRDVHERLADLGVRILGAVVSGAKGDGSRGYAYRYARGSLGGPRREN